MVPNIHHFMKQTIMMSFSQKQKADQTISDRLDTPNLRIFAIIRITISFSS